MLRAQPFPPVLQLFAFNRTKFLWDRATFPPGAARPPEPLTDLLSAL